MSDRRKVLEFFEAQKEETQRKVAEGIEKYRKGDMRITVVDANGRVIPDAKVSIKQKNHEFRFGANIFLLDEPTAALDPVAEYEIYTQFNNMINSHKQL